MLKNDPNWLEYRMRCKELNEKSSLRGFNRWLTSTTNAVTFFHNIDPDGELKKKIAEEREFLNVVCR